MNIDRFTFMLFPEPNPKIATIMSDTTEMQVMTR